MKNQKYQQLVDLVVFALLGVIMFVSKYLTEALPNVHFIGMLTMTYTIVYRKKALIPIYVFVLLIGIFNGFNMWWIPYLYIWTWWILPLRYLSVPWNFGIVSVRLSQVPWKK